MHEFFANQPPMGSFSLLLRAPLAAAARAVGGKDLVVYRFGAFACVLALAYPSNVFAGQSITTALLRHSINAWAFTSTL